jgi:ribonucleoside-diphosphate reductase beta chain
MEIFDNDWAAEWMRAINSDPAYREAGRGWEGGLVLRMWASERLRERVLFVDLHQGECLAARVATSADLNDAPFIIGAPAATWRQVLEGRIDPILGLLQSKLRLERGNLLRLVPYARAAKVLLGAATRVPGEFPSDDATPGSTSDDSPAVAGIPSASAHEAGTRRFRTLSGPGLDHSLVPMRLWHRAKKIGAWDPLDISLDRDREDWIRLTELERDAVLRLTVLFQAGEEAVTRDLLPLMATIAAERRLEEEIYLTSFLMEEAKHVEMFRRFLDHVPRDAGDLTRFESASSRRLFREELPAAMNALNANRSAQTQARAAAIYHMIVEGVLAETGYHAYHHMLERNGLMPGMQRAIHYIRRDESRHLAFGLYFIGRLIAEHGEIVRSVLQSELARLLNVALDVIKDVFAAYDVAPFGLKLDEYLAFATSQFQRRIARLDSVGDHSLDEILRSEITPL